MIKERSEVTAGRHLLPFAGVGMPLLWALLVTANAGAQEREAAACTTAECHLAAGLAARAAGHDEPAVASFRAAYELGGTPRALAQLALAEQAVGRWVDADAHLTDALGRDDEWIRSHRAVLEGALRTIHEHVGQLEVTSNVAGVLSINGVAAGTLPLSAPIAVEAGTAVLELSAEGYLPVQRRAEITAGQLTRVRVNMVERASPDEGAHVTPPAPSDVVEPALPSAPTAPGGPSALFIAALVGAGLGAISAAGTIAAAIVREEHVQVWNDPLQCPSSPAGRLAACPGTYSTFTTAEHWAIAGAVTTGIFAAASITLAALAASEDGAEQAASVLLDLRPDGVGLYARGSF